MPPFLHNLAAPPFGWYNLAASSLEAGWSAEERTAGWTERKPICAKEGSRPRSELPAPRGGRASRSAGRRKTSSAFDAAGNLLFRLETVGLGLLFLALRSIPPLVPATREDDRPARQHRPHVRADGVRVHRAAGLRRADRRPPPAGRDVRELEAVGDRRIARGRDCRAARLLPAGLAAGRRVAERRNGGRRQRSPPGWQPDRHPRLARVGRGRVSRSLRRQGALATARCTTGIADGMGLARRPPGRISDRRNDTTSCFRRGRRRTARRRCRWRASSAASTRRWCRSTKGPVVTQFDIEPGWEVKYRTVAERDRDGRPVYDRDGKPKTRSEEVSRTRVRVNQITSAVERPRAGAGRAVAAHRGAGAGTQRRRHRGAEHGRVRRHAAQRDRDAGLPAPRGARPSWRCPWARASPASRSSPTWRRCRTC